MTSLVTDTFIGILLAVHLTKGGHLEIGNLPGARTIHEDTKSSVFIYSVFAYPLTATCTISAGNTGTNFQITKANDQHTVTTVASPTFDFGPTPSYTLTITCTESTETQTGIITVTITENSAPVFTNLPGTVTISAKTVKANYVIFTISYTDTDDTPPLTYSNTVITPSGGPFADVADDQLKVNADLLDHKVASYVIAFDVTDGRTLTSQQITVTINDINTIPQFIGTTDVTISVPENTAGRVLIHELQYSDGDGDAVLFEYQPVVAANSIFDLTGGTGKIYLQSGNTLDYENNPQYVFTIQISDYIDTSTTYFTLTLAVTDINEAPTYTGTPSAVSVAESAAGISIGTPSALCTDPDGDTLTYSILFSTYSSYFTIVGSTAAVSFAQNWDFDTTLPSSVSLTIRCSDPDGVSDDATYQITITDINDNDPICSPSQTTFSLQYDQTISTTLTNIQCSDLDSTVNADLEYSAIGLTSGYSVTYFDVDTSGNVSIKLAFAMDYNTTFYVTLLVKDKGTPARSVTVTLTVTYTEMPTVITYSESTPCFLCTTGAITLIASMGFVLLITIIFCGVLCVLKCVYDSERRKIRKTLAKKKKSTWRLCDCCRPGQRKKHKKSQKEIEAAEEKDREYMRARNALLEEEHDDIHPINNRFEETKHVPDAAIPLKPTSRKRRTRHSVSPSSIAPSPIQSVTANVSLYGRDKIKTAAAINAPRSMTASQRGQWEKFREMQNASNRDEAGPTSAIASSKVQSGLVKKSQAASGMVWAFEGRRN